MSEPAQISFQLKECPWNNRDNPRILFINSGHRTDMELIINEHYMEEISDEILEIIELKNEHQSA